MRAAIHLAKATATCIVALARSLFGESGDPRDHLAKDEVVKRKDEIPIEESEQAAGLKKCRLRETRPPVAQLVRVELQPRFAREFHLSAKPQNVVGFQSLDAPKVDGIAYAQIGCAAAAPPQTDTSNRAIQDAAQLP